MHDELAKKRKRLEKEQALLKKRNRVELQKSSRELLDRQKSVIAPETPAEVSSDFVDDERVVAISKISDTEKSISDLAQQLPSHYPVVDLGDDSIESCGSTTLSQLVGILVVCGIMLIVGYNVLGAVMGELASPSGYNTTVASDDAFISAFNLVPVILIALAAVMAIGLGVRAFGTDINDSDYDENEDSDYDEDDDSLLVSRYITDYADDEDDDYDD